MPTNENLPVVAVDNADHRCHAETTVGHLKGYSYWFHAQLASDIYIYALRLFNIAMEKGPFIDGLPIKNGAFLWLCYLKAAL